ncbi:MAG: RidA family protein [Bryobacterales bacterium]|nr:RidA family protein [Bryobacterales bacterium]
MKNAPPSSSRRKLFEAAALGLAASSAAQAAPGDWTPKKASANGPIRSGHLLFMSGIGGWYPERRKEAGDAKVQMRSVLESMKASLEKAGSSLDNVLKVSVALVDPENNWEPMNEVYEEFFKGKVKPARSYWGATGFRRKGQLLQVDCIAYVD